MTASVRQPSLSDVNVPAFVLAAAAALGLVISALGSWVTTPFGALAGTSTADGKIVLGVGIVAGIAVFIRSVVASLIAVVVISLCGIGGLLTAITDIVAFEDEDASIGWGLWLVPVTSVALLISSVVLLWKHPYGARSAGQESEQAQHVTPAQERRYIILVVVLMVLTVALLAVAVVTGISG